MTTDPAADRQVIVVDVETTGLDPTRHIAVEVAWHNLHTGGHDVFVPPHSWADAVTNADPQALRVNRYLDRIADAEQDPGPAAHALRDQLDGNVFAGSNPTFDAQFVRKMFAQTYRFNEDRRIRSAVDLPRWHHRLLDLSAYAAGVWGLPLHQLPGLTQVCQLLGVEHHDPHTAAGDVAATVECFRKLDRIAQQRAQHHRQVAQALSVARDWWAALLERRAQHQPGGIITTEITNP